MVGDMQCLAEPFCAYTKRIGIILQHISENEVLQDAVVIVAYRVDGCMRFHTQPVCMIGNARKFFIGESAGIYNNAVYFVSHFSRKIFYAKRSIQSAAESQNYFFSMHMRLIFNYRLKK